MSNQNLPLNLIMQAKGGVGKSVAAFVLAQYLRDSLGVENVALLDTDPSNNTFSKYKGLKVKYVNPLTRNEDTGEEKVDTVAINAIFESIMSINKAIIVDTGSSNYIDLKSYLEINQTLNLFSEEETIAREVIIHVLINGGTDFSICCIELGKMRETFPTVQFVVWLNANGGELKYQGKEFKETQVYLDLVKSKQLKGIMTLPKLDANAEKDFKDMMIAGLTFEEAKYDIDTLNIMKKSRIERLKQKFFMLLDDIFPTYAEQREKRNNPSEKAK